jgi:hypothetical protein
MAQVAGAAGNTPINTPARAARSALYALDLPNALSQRVNNDDYSARVIIEHGFDLLEAATTVEALLASPRGIVVACPYGGTLTGAHDAQRAAHGCLRLGGLQTGRPRRAGVFAERPRPKCS